MSEWKEAKEEKAEEVAVEVAEAPSISDGMTSFIKETKELFDKLPENVKPKEEPKEEVKAEPEVKTEEVKPEPPKFEPRKDDSHFIPDLDKATPDDLKKRLGYLYAKTKENERLWAEARDFQKRQTDELEKLRATQVKERLAKTEADLDSDQLKVIDLLDRNSPNYNAADGAKLLRDLTRRDAALRQEREAEEKRTQEVKAPTTEPQGRFKDVEASKRVIDTWAETRDYTKPTHPLYGQVQTWLKQAYELAPPDTSTVDIVKRAEEVFDAYVAKQIKPKTDAPGTGLTVSQVIGTTQAKPTQADPVSKLTQQQKHVAERLFFDPEKKVTKEMAYRMYAEGI